MILIVIKVGVVVWDGISFINGVIINVRINKIFVIKDVRFVFLFFFILAVFLM